VRLAVCFTHGLKPSRSLLGFLICVGGFAYRAVCDFVRTLRPIGLNDATHVVACVSFKTFNFRETVNRNLLSKRKCKVLPSVASVPVLPRNEECRAGAPGLPESSDSQKRLAIKTRVIVVISSDLEFDMRLRMLAMQNGQILIRVGSMDDALRIVDADCCGVVLLDLDSLGRMALDMAADLLEHPLCPPVILLAGQSDQLELRTTVFAGSILEKSIDARRILNLLKQILEGLRPNPDKPAEQRGIIRWQESGNEAGPRVPTKRFWGINE